MITLYDTTLRDGCQSEGINFTVRDKLRITQMLDEFGLTMIEGGWPGSNPKDATFFQDVKALSLKHAKIAAFGSTCHPSSAPDDDANIRALLDADTPVVTVVGKAWTRHVTQVLRTDLDNNLRIIRESIAHLAAAGREVIYDAEHFFDGYVADKDYALATVAAAVEGGATTVVLCDTNGGMMPWQIDQIVRDVRGATNAALGCHVHNDNGCAVANSLAAIHAGCTHVQGTVNGIGERCGNADLCAIIANLELKTADRVLPTGQLQQLTSLSRRISEIANMPHPAHAPFVGRSAFAHKGGIHVAAIQRDDGSYEHIHPEMVGNVRRVLVSELSGRGNLRHKVEQFGLNGSDDTLVESVLEDIKKLESRGFAFEAAEASVEMMIRRKQPDYRPFFELMDFMVVVEHRQGRGLLAEASTKLRIGETTYHTAAEGVGPVDALDRAMRKALVEAYPDVMKFHLVDYKVRILDTDHATRAITRVLIETAGDNDVWTTVGASKNIIEASWQAVFDGIEYGLLKTIGQDDSKHTPTS
ncbi:MAG: citramalate synthase [Planctomycetota bacterium]|jgi:2-isopropylmalate synthase